jgi:hypothetical protein
MSIPETAITRRGALAVGAGVVIGGLGLSRAAQAAPEGKPVRLTPAQLAGPWLPLASWPSRASSPAPGRPAR